MKCRYLYQNEKIVALVNFFSENFEMNVVYLAHAREQHAFLVSSEFSRSWQNLTAPTVTGEVHALK